MASPRGLKPGNLSDNVQMYSYIARESNDPEDSTKSTHPSLGGLRSSGGRSAGPRRQRGRV
jgi:hypothetical protein